MKKYICILLLSTCNYLFSQDIDYCKVFNTTNNNRINSLINNVYNSNNGAFFPTNGTYRALSVFVNIIYDQTPVNDPFPNSSSTVWSSVTNDFINTNPPTYLLSLFDTNIQTSGNYNGVVSRFYSESSFNQLILLSDFIIVNIKQSQITPNNPGSSFSYSTLMNAVVTYINTRGFQTYYGHNSGSEYDKISGNSFGLPKPTQSDSNIDLTCFLIRNITDNFGGLHSGSGVTGVTPSVALTIAGQSYGYNNVTCQAIGEGDITRYRRSILTHELAHLFLGDNSFHTSGSVTNNDNYANTFIGGQSGYSLFEGMISCNAYERWRLGWHGPTNNNYQIASNNVESDITEKFIGEREFLLRDFVTYGDAIRIKLPYKDSEQASNQYIWIENHQMNKNNKMDYHIYADANPCRDPDQAGIYAYYQVGKDILESTLYNDVFPSNEKDNLRIISAEGNYNLIYRTSIEDCLGWSGGAGRPQFEYISPNPLQGINDQNEAFSYNTSLTSLQYPSDFKFVGSKIKNNILQNDLPWLGDKLDAFIPNPEIIMNVCTNPSPANTITYYSTRNGNLMQIVTPERNTRKLYLTGLSIKMIDSDPTNTEMKAFTAKVRWDDYDVKQDVNWTGDIVLKEQLNLLQNKAITLQQSYTVNQMPKDPVSNNFAKTTYFTCESNSTFSMAANSVVSLKDKSSFIMNNNSTLTIQDGAIITVENGSTLQIKTGANLNVIGTGKIVVKSGGFICVESGASINLQDYASLIVLEEDAVLGANPSLFTNTTCGSSISKTGNGSIIDYSQDVYIQNETIGTNRYIGGKNIYVGNHVDTNQTYGDVLINNGANVIIDCKNITFDSGFECAAGSSFEVKNH